MPEKNAKKDTMLTLDSPTSPPSTSRSSSSRQRSERMKKLPQIQVRLANHDIMSTDSSGNLVRERRNTIDELPIRFNPFQGSPKSGRKVQPITKTDDNSECDDTTIRESNSSLLLSQRERSNTTDSPTTSSQVFDSSTRSNLFGDSTNHTSLSNKYGTRPPISIGKRMDLLDKIQRQNSLMLSQRSLSSCDTTEMDMSQTSLKYPDSPMGSRQRMTRSYPSERSMSIDSNDYISSPTTRNSTSTKRNKMKPKLVFKAPSSVSEKSKDDMEIQLASDVKDSLNEVDMEERNDKSNDTPVSLSTSEKKMFSTRTLWSTFTTMRTSIGNILEALDSPY